MEKIKNGRLDKDCLPNEQTQGLVNFLAFVQILVSNVKKGRDSSYQGSLKIGGRKNDVVLILLIERGEKVALTIKILEGRDLN